MNFFKYAQVTYFIPFGFLLLGIIDAVTFDILGALSLVFLATLLPCSLIGMALSISGIVFWRKKRHTVKIDIGIALVYLGIFLSFWVRLV